MDRFQEMTAFVAVVEAGSFVRAAGALQISTSAASRLISDLEERLAVRLLSRTTRKLSLTPEGEVFLDRCRYLLTGVEAAEAEISAHAAEAVGNLRGNVPVSFGLAYLASTWAEFLERNPKVSLDITVSDRVVDLVEEGFDFAVRIARLPNSSLVFRKFASTRLVACASPDYLAKHGTPAHPSELTQHATVNYSLLSTGDTWEFEKDGEVIQVKISPRMHSNSGDVCTEAGLGGAGIVLQPMFLVATELADGRLIEVCPGYKSAELGVYAVYPSTKNLSPKVRAVVDFLVEKFQARLWPE